MVDYKSDIKFGETIFRGKFGPFSSFRVTNVHLRYKLCKEETVNDNIFDIW